MSDSKSPTAAQVVAIGTALLLEKREGAAMPGRVVYVARSLPSPGKPALVLPTRKKHV